MELFKITCRYIRSDGSKGHRSKYGKTYKSELAAVHALTAFKNSGWHNHHFCDFQIEHYYREPPKGTPPPTPSIISKVLGYLNLNTGAFKPA